MINGKLFAKFQKLLPKMNKGLTARHYAKNAFFMADAKGCAATDGFSLLYAPVDDACEQPVALTELPKAKFGDSVFIDTDKFEATIKDGGTSATVPRNERSNDALIVRLRKTYVREMPAYEVPAVITVNAALLKNLLDAFEGDFRIEITNPEGKYYERQLYLYGENLQAMLLPVKPVEARK